MDEKSTRFLIIILTLFTALVHLVALNLGGIQPLFVLNGLGYFALLGALLWRIPAGRERLVHYAFMAYTAVTIVAWVFVGTRSMLGYSTKLVEVLLIVFLWLNLQRVSAKK
jgi:hypothetical protein